jgi:hypothetical protein
VEKGGGIYEASWPTRLISTPPATTVALAADVSRCQRRRGGGTTEASKPTRLSCQTANLFTGVDQSHQGGARREVGREKLSRPHGLLGCNSRPAATTSKRSTLRRPL